MFKKNKCKKCGEKVSNSYNFCPYCSAPLKDFFKEEDYGLLGKNDFVFYNEPKISGLNNIIHSLVKNLNEQIEKIENEKSKKSPSATGVDTRKSRKSGISISISTSNNKPPEIRVSSFGDLPEIKEEKFTKKISLPTASPKRFAGLSKKEPETNIRRFSNKVLYEINLPGVKSIKDISIIQLENSIEIKALAKDKVFYKVIPISLPIKRYNLSKGKLVLELDSHE